MRIRNRIIKIEKVLPNKKHYSEITEHELVSEWLIENSEEFRECVRQLFRLRCKVDDCLENRDEREEPYREKAEEYMNCINQLIKKHRGSVIEILP
ncbi:hypothetical protein [Peribacillus frigoritolerans]|uniref:hypothetical protein n=1 Tax=Peribacillus frigoritolerans TaxID=450367 RepID=UPI0034242C02